MPCVKKKKKKSTDYPNILSDQISPSVDFFYSQVGTNLHIPRGQCQDSSGSNCEKGIQRLWDIIFTRVQTLLGSCWRRQRSNSSIINRIQDQKISVSFPWCAPALLCRHPRCRCGVLPESLVPGPCTQHSGMGYVPFALLWCGGGSGGYPVRLGYPVELEMDSNILFVPVDELPGLWDCLLSLGSSCVLLFLDIHVAWLGLASAVWPLLALGGVPWESVEIFLHVSCSGRWSPQHFGFLSVLDIWGFCAHMVLITHPVFWCLVSDGSAGVAGVLTT